MEQIINSVQINVLWKVDLFDDMDSSFCEMFRYLAEILLRTVLDI